MKNLKSVQGISVIGEGENNAGYHPFDSDFGLFNVSLDWLMKGIKPGEGVLQEQKAAYFFGVMGPLNCQAEDLETEEQNFILEYVEFAKYRKQKSEKDKTKPE